MSPRRISKLITKIENSLAQEYGTREFTPHGSAMDVLIGTILSQNTSDDNSSRAHKNLKKKFSSYKALGNADMDDIAKAIKSGGLADRKSKSISSALKQIKSDQGRHTLSNLKNISDKEALKYLLSLPGVGEKTAACVLLFALGREVMPVDTHIHRITLRLGLVQNTNDRSKSFQFWFGQNIDDYYTFHLNLIRHGRRVCRAGRPLCERCVIRNWCEYYTEKVKNG